MTILTEADRRSEGRIHRRRRRVVAISIRANPGVDLTRDQLWLGTARVTNISWLRGPVNGENEEVSNKMIVNLQP